MPNNQPVRIPLSIHRELVSIDPDPKCPDYDLIIALYRPTNKGKPLSSENALGTIDMTDFEAWLNQQEKESKLRVGYHLLRLNTVRDLVRKKVIHLTCFPVVAIKDKEESCGEQHLEACKVDSNGGEGRCQNATSMVEVNPFFVVFGKEIPKAKEEQS